ncbi:MAG: hypothetical protein AUH81_19355 [Candidatus Rokubacteria bacterium 13_1_40CM_4_69_5]|nr:MAG: hypothetical protein AUH81_19355 [Candidatus Rokubacteria bacterium 13_1_40CM_4_69_5]
MHSGRGMSTRTLALLLLLVVLALMPGLMMGYAVVSRTAPAISAVKSARARAVLDVVAGTVSTSPTLAATEERLEPEKLALKTELEKPAVVGSRVRGGRYRRPGGEPAGQRCDDPIPLRQSSPSPDLPRGIARAGENLPRLVNLPPGPGWSRGIPGPTNLVPLRSFQRSPGLAHPSQLTCGMMTSSRARSLEAPMTLLALAFLLALGAGVGALAGTEPFISPTGDVRATGDVTGPERLVRPAR